METDQPNRQDTVPRQEAGRGSETTRNAEPAPAEQQTFEREREPQDDLILHDDDEAELDLPR